MMSNHFELMQAQLLMIVHHKNLVSLVGYCDEGDNLALIYEYMANGDLRKKLSGVRDINCRLPVLDYYYYYLFFFFGLSSDITSNPLFLTPCPPLKLALLDC